VYLVASTRCLDSSSIILGIPGGAEANKGDELNKYPNKLLCEKLSIISDLLASMLPSGIALALGILDETATAAIRIEKCSLQVF